MRSTTFLQTLRTRGALWVLFELRNLVEAVILTVPVLYLCIASLPLDLSTKIMVTLVVVVPIGGFGLIGINDDSLTRWVKDWWRWRKKRRIIQFRGENKLSDLKKLIFGGGVRNRRQWRVPGQYSGVAPSQKYHWRRYHHKGQSFCEDLGGAAGQHLFEITQ